MEEHLAPEISRDRAACCRQDESGAKNGSWRVHSGEIQIRSPRGGRGRWTSQCHGHAGRTRRASAYQRTAARQVGRGHNNPVSSAVSRASSTRAGPPRADEDKRRLESRAISVAAGDSRSTVSGAPRGVGDLLRATTARSRASERSRRSRSPRRTLAAMVRRAGSRDWEWVWVVMRRQPLVTPLRGALRAIKRTPDDRRNEF